MLKKICVLLVMLTILMGCTDNKEELTAEKFEKLAEEYDENRQGTMIVKEVTEFEGIEVTNQEIYHAKDYIKHQNFLSGNEGIIECDIVYDDSTYKAKLVTIDGYYSIYDETAGVSFCEGLYVSSARKFGSLSALKLFNETYEIENGEFTENKLYIKDDYYVYSFKVDDDETDEYIKLSIHKDGKILKVEFKSGDEAYSLTVVEWE